jgi:hypothetical protein
MAIFICSGLLYSTGWAAQPSEEISRHFFQGQRNPLIYCGVNRLTIAKKWDLVKAEVLEHVMPSALEDTCQKGMKVQY